MGRKSICNDSQYNARQITASQTTVYKIDTKHGNLHEGGIYGCYWELIISLKVITHYNDSPCSSSVVSLFSYFAASCNEQKIMHGISLGKTPATEYFHIADLCLNAEKGYLDN